MTQPSQNNSKTDLSKLDTGQIFKDTHIPKDNALKTIKGNSLVPNEFTEVRLTYVASGDGKDEIETATYYDAGTKQVSSFFVTGDNQGVAEITRFSFIDLTAVGLSQKWFKMYDDTGSVAVFFALDSDVTIPNTGAVRNLKVDITTGDTLEVIASKTQVIITADSEFTAAYGGKTVAVTSVTLGNKINGIDVNSGIFVDIFREGQNAAPLNNKYFNIYSPTITFYCWYNVGGSGVDPTPGGTGIEITIDNNETEENVLSKTIATINANKYFTSKEKDERVFVTSNQPGSTTAASDGNTGFGHFITALSGEDRQIIRVLELEYNSKNCISSIISY